MMKNRRILKEVKIKVTIGLILKMEMYKEHKELNQMSRSVK